MHQTKVEQKPEEKGVLQVSSTRPRVHHWFWSSRLASEAERSHATLIRHSPVLIAVLQSGSSLKRQLHWSQDSLNVTTLHITFQNCIIHYTARFTFHNNNTHISDSDWRVVLIGKVWVSNIIYDSMCKFVDWFHNNIFPICAWQHPSREVFPLCVRECLSLTKTQGIHAETA